MSLQLRGSSGFTPLSRASQCNHRGAIRHASKGPAAHGAKAVAESYLFGVPAPALRREGPLGSLRGCPALPSKPETPIRWGPGRSPDLRVTESVRLPGFPVAYRSDSQRLQLRGSGGFSPRFPITKWGNLYLTPTLPVKGICRAKKRGRISVLSRESNVTFVIW